MDELLKITRTTSNKIERLEKYVNKMKKLIKDKTNNILTDEKEKKHNFKIDAANEIFRKKSSKINKLIYKIREINEETNIGKKTKELQIKNLSLRFSKVLNNYREVQILNKNQELKRTKKEYLIMNPKANSDDLNKYLNSKGKTKKSIFSVGSEKSNILNKKIEKRHERIKNISKNAIEIAELIQTNKDLVFSQKDIIDKIEINIETTLEDIEEANENLETAQEYQRSANYIRDNIIKIIIGFSIISGIGFIIYIYLNRNKN